MGINNVVICRPAGGLKSCYLACDLKEVARACLRTNKPALQDQGKPKYFSEDRQSPVYEFEFGAATTVC